MKKFRLNIWGLLLCLIMILLVSNCERITPSGPHRTIDCSQESIDHSGRCPVLEQAEIVQYTRNGNTVYRLRLHIFPGGDIRTPLRLEKATLRLNKGKQVDLDTTDLQSGNYYTWEIPIARTLVEKDSRIVLDIYARNSLNYERSWATVVRGAPNCNKYITLLLPDIDTIRLSPGDSASFPFYFRRIIDDSCDCFNTTSEVRLALDTLENYYDLHDNKHHYRDVRAVFKSYSFSPGIIDPNASDIRLTLHITLADSLMPSTNFDIGVYASFEQEGIGTFHCYQYGSLHFFILPKEAQHPGDDPSDKMDCRNPIPPDIGGIVLEDLEGNEIISGHIAYGTEFIARAVGFRSNNPGSSLTFQWDTAYDYVEPRFIADTGSFIRLKAEGSVGTTVHELYVQATDGCHGKVPGYNGIVAATLTYGVERTDSSGSGNPGDEPSNEPDCSNPVPPTVGTITLEDLQGNPITSPIAAGTEFIARAVGFHSDNPNSAMSLQWDPLYQGPGTMPNLTTYSADFIKLKAEGPSGTQYGIYVEGTDGCHGQAEGYNGVVSTYIVYEVE